MRVCVVCEGKTESDFIQSCIGEALNNAHFYLYPAIIQDKSAASRGGSITVERLTKFIRCQYYEANRITTFVDFYGFQRADGRSAAELEAAIMAELQQINELEPRFILPYVQVHEFEALLFSDVDKFRCVFDGWNDSVRQELTKIRERFTSPEDINNHRTTAPSKRILQAFKQRHYRKATHGPVIAKQIGLTTIRQQCPRFNQWLEKIEAWKAESHS